MHRAFVALAFLIGLALVLPSVAWAEDEEPNIFEVTTQEPIALGDFLRLVGASLEVPLYWDAKSRSIQSRTITGSQNLMGTRKEVFELLQSLLMQHDLVIVPMGPKSRPIYLVLEARQSSSVLRFRPRFVELDDARADELEDQHGAFITTVIPVKHMGRLRDARNALNRIVTQQQIGNVTEVPDARAFVVTDFAPNVVAVWRLLRKMDVPVARQVGRVFRAVRLEHAQASQAVETLQAHFETGPHRLRPAHDPDEPPDEVPEAILRIHADARLNQILVSGSEEAVKPVLEAIEAMDRPAEPTAPEPIETELEIVRLKHIRAPEAEASLHALLRQTQKVWTEDQKVPLPAVVAHSETNALLLQATPAALARLRRLIGDLDQPQPTAAGEGGGG